MCTDGKHIPLNVTYCNTLTIQLRRLSEAVIHILITYINVMSIDTILKIVQYLVYIKKVFGLKLICTLSLLGVNEFAIRLHSCSIQGNRGRWYLWTSPSQENRSNCTGALFSGCRKY